MTNCYRNIQQFSCHGGKEMLCHLKILGCAMVDDDSPWNVMFTAA